MIGDASFWNWLVGGLALTVKSLLLYIWVKHDNKIAEIADSHSKLKDRLIEDYWDSDETQQYMDRAMFPIQRSLDNVVETNRELIVELRKLNEKVIVLETVERVNGRRTRGSP